VGGAALWNLARKGIGRDSVGRLRYIAPMSKFYHGDTLLREPKDVQPFLGNPDLHWAPGYSAYELASSWIGAGGIPHQVRQVLDACEDYRGARLIMASMEHATPIPGRGSPSQSDAMVHAYCAAGRVVISVEGKVREPFGELVSKWMAGDSNIVLRGDALIRSLANRRARIDGLASILGLACDVSGLRYQLLHRTAAAVIEARQHGATHALMLVHSFCRDRSSFADFQRFAAAMQAPVSAVNTISPARQLNDVSLRLGWVADIARG
jgi:hypothetical protein